MRSCCLYNQHWIKADCSLPDIQNPTPYYFLALALDFHTSGQGDSSKWVSLPTPTLPLPGEH